VEVYSIEKWKSQRGRRFTALRNEKSQRGRRFTALRNGKARGDGGLQR
jgi:hypothetical protein